MSGQPIADPEAIRNLLAGLCGVKTEVRLISQVPLAHAPASYAGVYVGNDLKPRAAWVCDLSLAAGLAAALTWVPARMATEAVAAKALPAALFDSLKEVLNVGAQLFSTEFAPHVKLHEVARPPPGWITEPHWAHLNLEIQLQGYPTGRCSLIALR